MSTSHPTPVTARDRWVGRLFGMAAMLAMLAVIVLGRAYTSAVSLLDAIADALLLAMPLSIFAWLLNLFGTGAKTLLLAGLVLLLLLVGAGIGGRFMGDTIREPGRAGARVTIVALVIFLTGISFILLFVNAHTPELLANGGFLRTALVLGVASILFGGVLAGLTVVWLSAQKEGGDAGRRRVLAAGGVVVAGLAGVGIVGREVGRVATRRTNTGGAGGRLSPAITPNDDFYIVSKNFVDPDDDRGPDWPIAVAGLVDNRMTLTRAGLAAMSEAGEFVSTQLCISNPVGGGLIGTAEWTGVPIGTVLDLAGVQPGAVKVVFEGVDGYSTGIPIERVLQPASHLVWGMNGEPLPREHGAPVRAIIPGLYGMKSVKWLTKLIVTGDDYKGYWEERNWTDDATIKTMSRIDSPADHDVLDAGLVEIGGIAFAGDRGISAVEVSADDGETWRTAEIREDPNPEGVAWVVWTLAWEATPGAHVLIVRAIQANGTVQTDASAPPLPDGSSGWHRVTVGVV